VGGENLAAGYWRFIELPRGKWAWELLEPDGSLCRVGPFASLEACTRNAREYGFQESDLDRRKDPRQPNWRVGT